MRVLLSLVALSLSTSSASIVSDATGLLRPATGVLPNSVDNTANTAIGQTLSIPLELASSQCSTIKSLAQLEYEQLRKSGRDPDLSKVTLNYITRHTKLTYLLASAHEEIPRSYWFNPELPLVIFAHGYTESADQPSSLNIINAFLRRGDVNIVSLDASYLIALEYFSSTSFVTYIGKFLGEFIAKLFHAGTSPSNIHVVGFSLGAHIAGFAGKRFAEITGHKVGRITGLDPAGPCYTDIDSNMKLSWTDAKFVDVMHSNAGVLGLDERGGHADFWPNGGHSQPDCTLQFNCSHFRAILMFAESVQHPHNFKAVSCDSWTDFQEGRCSDGETSLMGYGCSSSTRGSYYLQTDDHRPFGLGDYGTTYHGYY